jgi:hypothetical protein
MAIVMKGQKADSTYTNVKVTDNGALATVAGGGETSEVVLASATGSAGGLGKIGTIAATTGTLLVMCPNPDHAGQIDWRIKSDQAYSVQFYRSRTIPTITLTMADATAVDDGDNFVLNGLTFQAETTEGDAVASERKWYHASQAAGSVACAALLQHATYGVPGVTAAAAAVDATDVITITPTTATVLQFGQGSSASNEIALTDTRITSLGKDVGGMYSALAANTTTSAGDIFTQFIDGWPYAWAYISNGSGSAQTVTVAASIHT